MGSAVIPDPSANHPEEAVLMRSLLISLAALIVSFTVLLAGNSLQFVVLGLRADIEGFSVEAMGVITACYFLGAGLGAYFGPRIVASAGHIRTFAALASVVSGVTLAHPLLPEPAAWGVMRLATGFCFAGLYMVVESWLNARTTNELRGRVLSVYGTASFAGYTAGPLLTGLGSSDGFVLFIVASMMVSFALVPVPLTRASAPVMERREEEEVTGGGRLNLARLYKETPLGVAGVVLLGAAQGTYLGLGPVFGSQIGLDAQWISIFVAVGLFVGLCLQYPIGWASDRFDRRFTIMAVAAAGGMLCVGAYLALTLLAPSPALAVAGAGLAGLSIFPLYAVVLAYTNDRLPQTSLVAAAAALALSFAIGSSIGPPLASAAMSGFGPPAFFLAIAVSMFALAAFAGYRMLRRAAPQRREGEETPAPTVAASPGLIPLDPYYDEADEEDGEARWQDDRARETS